MQAPTGRFGCRVVADRRTPATRPTVEVGPGSSAVRIMTGAPMPPGADAVVMVVRSGSAHRRTTVRCSKHRDGGSRSPRAARGRRHRPRSGGAGCRHRAHGSPPGGARLGNWCAAPPRWCPAPRWASSPRATSWSTTTARCNRARSARPTGPRWWPPPPASGCGRSTWAPCPTTATALRAALIDAARHLRRGGHHGWGEHGRRRPGEGGARRGGRHAVDAGGHPPGQALRLRRARRHARLRPARQPGVVAGVALAVLGVPGLRTLAGRPDLDLPRVPVRVMAPVRAHDDGRTAFVRATARWTGHGRAGWPAGRTRRWRTGRCGTGRRR
jgi:hypothetical protein